MFEIKDVKMFMDSVHGYITVPKCFVDNLIDTEYFQRLRNIDQTGMRVLYPDGKHDRYGHSLGVFHLGNKAVDALLDNFSHDNYWNIRSDYTNTLFWAKNKVLFLIACLLHDIGHAPFSHSLEKEVHQNSGGEKFQENLANLLNEKEKVELSAPEKVLPHHISAAPHEQLGAMLVLEKLNVNIERIFDSLIEARYPGAQSNGILYAEHYTHNSVISKEELESDLCFVARMILGLKYTEYTPEKQIRNCFIELLNGSNFDVDKLDYIIRDTKMSGMSNIAIDVERLLTSISIVTKTVYKDIEFQDDKKFSNLTIHAFDNSDNRGCVRICGAFKGTIKIFQGAKVKIQKDSTFVSLCGTEGDACIKFVGHGAWFNEKTVLFKEGEYVKAEKLPGNSSEGKCLTRNTNNKEFTCNISEAKVISDEGFWFEVADKYSVELEVNGQCDIEISEGDFGAKASLTFFENTILDGKVKEIVVLNNLIHDQAPSQCCYNTFSIGFKKQAMNIIANVLEARDYLYLWCYAHHKVIYYANFLIPSVSTSIFKGVSKKATFPKWQLNYKDIVFLDDAYIWTVIRFRRNNVSEALCALCNELLNRKYKISAWKSLAEYDLLFESFKESEKLDMRSFFANEIRSDLPNVPIGTEYSAGYVKEEFVEELIKMDDRLACINNIIFVDASYKQKNTDSHNTFVLMNDETAPMDKITLLSERIKISRRTTTHYFYLYYDTVSGAEMGKEERDLFKKNIKEIFDKKFHS